MSDLTNTAPSTDAFDYTRGVDLFPPYIGSCPTDVRLTSEDCVRDPESGLYVTGANPVSTAIIKPRIDTANTAIEASKSCASCFERYPTEADARSALAGCTASYMLLQLTNNTQQVPQTLRDECEEAVMRFGNPYRQLMANLRKVDPFDKSIKTIMNLQISRDGFNTPTFIQKLKNEPEAAYGTVRDFYPERLENSNIQRTENLSKAMGTRKSNWTYIPQPIQPIQSRRRRFQHSVPEAFVFSKYAMPDRFDIEAAGKCPGSNQDSEAESESLSNDTTRFIPPPSQSQAKSLQKITPRTRGAPPQFQDTALEVVAESDLCLP